MGEARFKMGGGGGGGGKPHYEIKFRPSVFAALKSTSQFPPQPTVSQRSDSSPEGNYSE